MLKFFNRQGVQVMGELEIGELKGLGMVAVFDKNGIIYKFLTRLKLQLKSLDTLDP